MDRLLHLSVGACACVVLTIIHYASYGLGLMVGCTALGVFCELRYWVRGSRIPDPLNALITASPGIAAFLFEVIV